jgi:hypothetical protein
MWWWLGVLLLLLASALIGPIIESIRERWIARKVREQLNDMRKRTKAGDLWDATRGRWKR